MLSFILLGVHVVKVNSGDKGRTATGSLGKNTRHDVNWEVNMNLSEPVRLPPTVIARFIAAE